MVVKFSNIFFQILYSILHIVGLFIKLFKSFSFFLSKTTDLDSVRVFSPHRYKEENNNNLEPQSFLKTALLCAGP